MTFDVKQPMSSRANTANKLKIQQAGILYVLSVLSGQLHHDKQEASSFHKQSTPPHLPINPLQGGCPFIPYDSWC